MLHRDGVVSSQHLTPARDFLAGHEILRPRILAIARAFVLSAAAAETDWLAQESTPWLATTIVAACVLLEEDNGEERPMLSEAELAACAPALLGSHFGSDESSQATLAKLVARVGGEATSNVLRIAARDATGNRVREVLRRLTLAPQNDMRDVLHELLDEGQPIGVQEELADALLSGGDARAERWLKGEIETVISSGDASDRVPNEQSERRQIAIRLALVLTRGSVGTSWVLLWPLMLQHEWFRKAVLGGIASSDSMRQEPRFFQHFDEGQLARLFLTLRRDFPPEEDLPWGGTITTRHDIARWRDRILPHLASRGSIATLEQIQRYTGADLEWTLLDAHRVRRERSWQPATPHEVRRLTSPAPKLGAADTERMFQAVCVIESVRTIPRDGVDELFAEQGTAFRLADVGILTAAHAVFESGEINAFLRQTPNFPWPVTLARRDDELDFALVTSEVPLPLALPLGDSDDLRRGDVVYVLGFPSWNRGDSGTVQPGVITGWREHFGTRLALTSALLVAGNSGGPVINDRGQVVGIALRGAPSFAEAHGTAVHGILPINTAIARIR